MLIRNSLAAFVASAALLVPVTSANAGKAEDTLVWSTATEVDTVDIYYQNLREVVIMAHQMCDTLIYREPDTMEYQPLLATSWTWTTPTQLDIELRKGVKFHNGDTFGAEDVAYTYNHTTAEDSGVVTREVVDWMKRVEVTGKHSVRIHLHQPFPPALEFLSGITPIYPEGHYEDAPEVPAAEGTRKDYGAVQPVCTGPYKLEEMEPGRSVTLTRNEEYFEDSPKGQPDIGTLKFVSIADTESQLAELMTGGIDWIWSVPRENADQIDAREGLTVKQAATMRVSFLNMDSAGRTGENPFQDIRVRRAVNHAIDKEALAANLVGSAARVLHSACFPTQFGCTQDVRQYPYDPEKARALLAEAGYPEGFETPLFAYRNRPYTEAVIGYLGEIGIDASLKFMQWKALRPKIYNDETRFAHLTWGSQGVNDIANITPHYFTSGPDDYDRDEVVKELLEKGNQETNPDKRKAIYKDALQRIAEKAYWAPLFSYARFYAFTSDLNFEPTPDEIAHFYRASWKN